LLLSMKALFKFKDFFDSGEKVCQQVELGPAEARRVRQLEILGCLVEDADVVFRKKAMEKGLVVGEMSQDDAESELQSSANL